MVIICDFHKTIFSSIFCQTLRNFSFSEMTELSLLHKSSSLLAQEVSSASSL